MTTPTRMTFTLVGRDRLSGAFRSAGLSAQRLQKDLRNVGAAAAIPSTAAGAAGAVALAGAMVSAGVAVSAFGAAVVPQVLAMGKAAEAQQQYKDAVAEHGRASSEAARAESAYLRQVKRLPPETRKAAAALTVLKDDYKAWSDAAADDTMPVLTKSFGLFSAILPRTSPLVRGAADELDRLMNVVGGLVASDGFDELSDDFTDFSVGALRDGVNGVIHLTRVLQGFDPQGGALGDFMDYARQHGPLVAETFKNIALAAVNLLQAGSPLGVAMLSVANALAKAVSAVPPEALGVLIQLYATFRLLSLGAAGLMAVVGVAGRLGTTLGGVRVAAVAATGGLATFRAGWLALSASMRGAVVIAAIAGIIVGLTKLASIGRSAPPDVDRLTTSLAQLGRTGRVSGEAARAFGADLDGLYDSIRSVSDPSTVDKIQQGLVKVFSLGMADSTPVKEAKENIDAIDDALANLVKGGKADLAAAAFARLKREYRAGGGDVSELQGRMEKYKSALADAKLEQQLAADSMGLFGQQAIRTKAQLDAQKQSADGLRQAIQALNDVNRAGLGGMIAFEQAVDDAAKAARKNAGALSMSGGKLNLNSQRARDAATALQDLAQRTDEAAGSARESGASWSRVNGIYQRGRAELIKNAQQMGLTRQQAVALADSILKIPDKTARLKGDVEDLERKVATAKKRIKSVPPSKVSDLRGHVRDLERKVARAKERLRSVPASKRSELRARIADLQAGVRRAKADLASIPRHVSTTVSVYYTAKNPGLLAKAHGRAHGGPVPAFAAGGGIPRFPTGGMLHGPGTTTSDSILIAASRGEYVVRAAAVQKYGQALFDQLNAMALPATRTPGMAARAAQPSPGTRAGGDTISNTYHLYQRDFTLADLERLQDRQERKARLRRPR